MATEFKGTKLLCSLNLMHNTLPFFGYADECFDLMMNLCSKTRRFWIEKCNILASVTLNDDRYWEELKFSQDLNTLNADKIVKYRFNLKYCLALYCNSQDSLLCMIDFLNKIKFIRLSKVSITLHSSYTDSYNEMIELLKTKGGDLSKISVELPDEFSTYGKINYLPKLDINSSNKFENIQQARCLKFKGEVPKDQLEDKLIVEQLYVDYIFRHMLKDCIDKLSEHTKNSIKSILFMKDTYSYSLTDIVESLSIIELSEALFLCPNLTEVSTTISSYTFLKSIPIFTKFWIEPKIKSLREENAEYKNEISLSYYPVLL